MPTFKEGAWIYIAAITITAIPMVLIVISDVLSEGKKEKECELDNRGCDCCQTSITMGKEGPVVIYRDRSEEEIREGFTYSVQT